LLQLRHGRGAEAAWAASGGTMVVLRGVAVACFVLLISVMGRAVQQVWTALGESFGDGAFGRRSLC
jgi:hypothetical protein